MKRTFLKSFFTPDTPHQDDSTGIPFDSSNHDEADADDGKNSAGNDKKKKKKEGKRMET